MATYTIHPIVMGTKVFDKGMMTYQHDYGTPYTIPIYCWYLDGGNQTILVDTGELSPIQSEDRAAAIGGPIHTFESGLAQHGLTPADVDIVIHTHLHADHCENDYKCENAVFYVHPLELESIRNPHPLDFRYMEDYIEDVADNGQIRDLPPDGVIAPGIRVTHTPVHTKGGMTVWVDTAAGNAAITGFCTIMENFDPPPAIRAMEMEVIPPGTAVAPEAAYDMMVAVRDAADFVLPLHEPAFADGKPIGGPRSETRQGSNP